MSLFDDKFDPPRHGGPTLEDVAAVAALAWDVEPRDCTPLVGGFRSAVFRVSGCELRDGADVVLRAAPRRFEDVLVETEVMELARDVVPVPKPLDIASGDQFVVMAMEYVDGAAIDRVLASIEEGEMRGLGSDVADLLVALRDIQFDESGFFSDGFQFEHTFDRMGDGFREHMLGCFDSRALERRLDSEERQALERFLRDHEPEYAEIHGTNLTHSDFNLKNILARRGDDGWSVAALIDWEFAFSGHTLVDVGNMLRFEDELPPQFVAGFVDRLNERLDLGPDWRWRARLLDLTSIVQFLTRPGRFPQTTRTARQVLHETLSRG